MVILKKITGYTLISLITSGISFLLLPVITKYLTPEDYGILSIFNASTNFLTALIPLGMNHILLVQLIKNRLEYPKHLSSFIKITTLVTIVITILLSLSSIFVSDFFGLDFGLAIFIPGIALMVIYYDVAISYFVYLKQFAKYAKLTLSKFFIEYLFVVILIVVIPLTWKGRILALIISLILVLVITGYFFHKKKVLVFNFSTKNIDKALIKNGFPLIFMGLSIMVINLSDRFFIEHFVGLKATGLYGIASTIAGILLIVIGSSMNVIRPMMYEKLKLENYNLTKLTLSYLLGLLFITMSLVLIIPYIFKYMINESYTEAIQYSYPLIFGLFFWGIFNYVISFFLYEKKNNFIGIVSLIGVFINLILNYYLILNFGTIGASYATLISYFVMSLIIVFSYLFLQKNN